MAPPADQTVLSPSAPLPPLVPATVARNAVALRDGMLNASSVGSDLIKSPVADWTVVLPLPPWVLAVLVSVGASAFTVAGFVMQKKALSDASAARWPRLGSVVLSPAWIAGFLLTAILPVLGDLAAYSLAPLTLTTPLSGVSVVLNMVIAPWALSEKLQSFPDVPATVLILIGCMFTTAFGDHDRTGPYTADDLVRLAARPPFAGSLLIGGAIGLSVVSNMNTRKLEIERLALQQQQNPHLPHVLMPALAAAMCGAVANIGLKAVGELMKGQNPNSNVIFVAMIVAPAAVAQVNFINRGLFLYPQSVFMSVYGALLVLSNTIYGAIFFEEYHALVRSSYCFSVFCVGFLMIVNGIWLFKLRRPGKGVHIKGQGDSVVEEDETDGDQEAPHEFKAMKNLGGEAGQDAFRQVTRRLP